MSFVLSSISGNLISAASAGFAPTNSADVSAIASAYQVVSATATQLNAGTAYLTSVNDAPISASRAGQAANASLASSAYYDGTGRLISSLPDSAAVSAIASAYAESAASGKQDSLTFGYDDDKISAINGSALAGQGGGGMITSIQSALDPWYATAISGLNGSSLYPQWAWSAKSAQSARTADWAWNAQSASAAPTAWASSFITGVSSPSGTIRVLGGTAIESTNSAVIPSTVIEGFSTSYAGATIGPSQKLHCVLPTTNPFTEIIMPFLYDAGRVVWSSDNGIEDSLVKGTSPETITAQVPNATAVDIWVSDNWIQVNTVTASASNQEIGGGVAELAWASALPTYSYDAEDKISAINGSAIAGGGAAGVDSATCSAIASAYAESAVSAASSNYYTTANESGFITGVDLTNYATTAYVDSSVSGKADSSALTSYALSADVSGTVDLVSSQSANWGGSALALSAGPGVKLEKSSDTLVAGLDETVLFSSVDGSAISTITASENLSNFERIRFYWYPWETAQGKGCQITEVANYNGGNYYTLECGWIPTGNPTGNRAVFIYMYSSDGTAFTQVGGGFNNLGSSTNWSEVNDIHTRCYKVVGINRTAGA